MATWQEHLAISQRFREQGFAEIESGDLLQGSEELWGAAAHAVKAVAEQRGWRHDSHALLFRAVRTMAATSGSPGIISLFQSANDLHINFYEAELDLERLLRNADYVSEFLDVISGLLDSHDRRSSR